MDQEKLFKISLKVIWKIPVFTNQLILQFATDQEIVKSKLFNILSNSPKLSIQYLTRIVSEDKSTVMGKTLQKLADMTNQSDISGLTSKGVKDGMLYFPVPEEEEWRLQISLELLSTRKNNDLEIPGFQTHEINSLLNHICSS